MHRYGGRPLLHEDLADIYDAFETPRAGPRRHRAPGPPRRARVPRRGARPHARGHRRARHRRRDAPRAGHPPRAPAHTRRCCRRCSSRAWRASRPPCRPTRAAAGGLTGLELIEIPAGACDHRRRRRGLRLRQRAPAPHASTLPAFRIGRTPVTNATWLPLRRGRRLRAPRAGGPTRAGRGRSSTTSHTRCAGRTTGARVATGQMGAARPGQARRPRLLVRGRRLRPRTRRPPPHRGRVGEGGDLGPERAQSVRGRALAPATPTSTSARSARSRSAPTRRARARAAALGMLGDVWEWTSSDFDGYPGFRAAPLPRVLRGLLRPRLQGPAWRLVGDRAPRGHRQPSATGTCPQRRQIFSGVRLAWDA